MLTRRPWWTQRSADRWAALTPASSLSAAMMIMRARGISGNIRLGMLAVPMAAQADIPVSCWRDSRSESKKGFVCGIAAGTRCGPRYRQGMGNSDLTGQVWRRRALHHDPIRDVPSSSNPFGMSLTRATSPTWLMPERRSHAYTVEHGIGGVTGGILGRKRRRSVYEG
jgi:hypothetical protein